LKFQDLLGNSKHKDTLASQIKDNGFAHLEEALSLEEVEHYLSSSKALHQSELENVAAGTRSNDVDFQTYHFKGAHLYNSPRQTRIFDPLLGHPILLSFLDHFFETKSILNQTELRNPIKNGKDNYAYEWHRDGRVLAKDTFWLIVFWLFNDIDETNGPCEIKKGTHLTDEHDQEAETIKLKGKAGDIIIMSNNILHRATVSYSNKDRWIFIPTYNPWFIKPSMDYTKVFSQKTFNQFTEEQKQIFGYTSIVPSDERKRLYTLNPWNEVIDEIPFPELKKNRAGPHA
jgi:hypothetical protein